jgi:hypothetical protein
MTQEELIKDTAARAKRIETRVSMLATALGCELAGSEPTFKLTQPNTPDDVHTVSTEHKHVTIMQLIKFMQTCDVYDVDVVHPAGYRFSIQLDRE